MLNRTAILQALSLFFFVFLLTPSIGQQVWTKKQGEFFSSIGANYYGYNSLLNGNEDLLPLRRAVNEILIQNYTEVGIIDDLVATVILPFGIISSSDEVLMDTSFQNMVLPAGQLAAPGNVQVGFTYGFMQEKAFRMAAKLNFSMNTASYKAPVGLRTGESAWAVSPTILAGYGHQYFFTSTELGYTYRTNGYSQQVFSNTQIGTTIKKKLYIILSMHLLFVLNQTDYDTANSDRANALQTGTYLNNRQYASPRLRFGYDITKNWSIWLGTGGLGIAGGQNLGAAATFDLAVSYQFKKEN